MGSSYRWDICLHAHPQPPRLGGGAKSRYRDIAQLKAHPTGSSPPGGMA